MKWLGKAFSCDVAGDGPVKTRSHMKVTKNAPKKVRESHGQPKNKTRRSWRHVKKSKFKLTKNDSRQIVKEADTTEREKAAKAKLIGTGFNSAALFEEETGTGKQYSTWSDLRYATRSKIGHVTSASRASHSRRVLETHAFQAECVRRRQTKCLCEPACKVALISSCEKFKVVRRGSPERYTLHEHAEVPANSIAFVDRTYIGRCKKQDWPVQQCKHLGWQPQVPGKMIEGDQITQALLHVFGQCDDKWHKVEKDRRAFLFRSESGEEDSGEEYKPGESSSDVDFSED